MSQVVPPVSAYAVAPSLLAWRMLASLGGSAFADTNAWATMLLGMLFHGCGAVVVGWCVGVLIERSVRFSRIPVIGRVTAVGVVYVALLVLGGPISRSGLP